jgi:hypothetical protein
LICTLPISHCSTRLSDNAENANRMADLGFAHDAGMQEGRGQNDYMEFIHKYMASFVVGLLNPSQYRSILTSFGIRRLALRPLHKPLLYLPQSKDLKIHHARGQALLSHRLKLGTKRKDLFTHLLEANETVASSGRKVMFTPAELYSNSSMVTIAGTDIISSTMAQLFLALATHPQIIHKMQKEIDAFCDEGNDLTVESTKKLVYTSAVITEALRLHNPLPSAIYAATSPCGLSFPLSKIMMAKEGRRFSSQVTSRS